MSTKYNTTARHTAQESMPVGQGLTLNFLEMVFNKKSFRSKSETFMFGIQIALASFCVE